MCPPLSLFLSHSLLFFSLLWHLQKLLLFFAGEFSSGFIWFCSSGVCIFFILPGFIHIFSPFRLKSVFNWWRRWYPEFFKCRALSIDAFLIKQVIFFVCGVFCFLLDWDYWDSGGFIYPVGFCRCRLLSFFTKKGFNFSNSSSFNIFCFAFKWVPLLGKYNLEYF